jgi:hypothetical protein
MRSWSTRSAGAGPGGRLAKHHDPIAEAAQAYDEAMAALHGGGGLISHPLTEGKRQLARNRLKVAIARLTEALDALTRAEIEAPFTPPPPAPPLSWAQLSALSPAKRAAAYLAASEQQRSAWREEAALAADTDRKIVPIGAARKASR